MNNHYNINSPPLLLQTSPRDETSSNTSIGVWPCTNLNSIIEDIGSGNTNTFRDDFLATPISPPLMTIEKFVQQMNLPNSSNPLPTIMIPTNPSQSASTTLTTTTSNAG